MAAGRREVIWAVRARQALEDALIYIAQDSPQNARQLALRVIDAADSLATFSERGGLVSELGDPSLRELLVEPYRVLYEVHDQEVHIVGFLHQRQQFRTRDRRSRQ
ncbi:MAG: type II toxin-antitoxin system RelE/ParE family toxin [Gemmatimonadetes bacterium]|nr:type II toxin-antitoxin system RelE/ParE family toxin [Gemmatimonadota bacterium]